LSGGAVRLALRLIGTGNVAAYYAMGLATLGVVATPLDLLLSRRERRLTESAPEQSHELVFVCGPPRSGTTLVARALIHCLDVAYVSNLTSVFPRSPLTATSLFGGSHRPKLVGRQYYGRTTGLSGVNDGLHLWDRWLGADRTGVVDRLDAADAEAMRRFFAALTAQAGKPLINKNNRLNCCAAAVGRALPQARFLCLEREPLFLAQSLLRARYDIVGSEQLSYGVDRRDPGDEVGTDPVADVVRQVRFHRSMARQQQRELGPDRFRIISYEAFCRNPRELISFVGREWLGLLLDPTRVDELPVLRVSQSVRVAPEVMARLEQAVEEAGFSRVDPQCADARDETRPDPRA